MMKTKKHDVTQAAMAILAKSSVKELRQLRVNRDANQLQLSGTVSSFYHKQLAQETVRPIAAGLQVVNQVRVGV